MEYGVALSWRGTTVDGTRTLCTEADRLGFEYFWITEAWGLEALSTAGYLLGFSRNIKIGTGVLNVFSRSAALIGMACATLDQISPGRFLLGIGASGKKLVENWHGVSFEKPSTRVKEYVKVIQRVVRGDPVDFRGETMKLSDFKLYAKPIERKQEIFLGAMGDRNLQLAGEISDGAIVTMYPISQLAHALHEVNGSALSGAKKEVFSYLQLKVAKNEAEKENAKTEIAKHIAFYVASMGANYARNLCKLGFEKDVNEIIAAHSSGGSKSAAQAVSEKLIGELSLIGTPEEIQEKVTGIPDGVTPVFVVDAPQDSDIRALKLDQLAPLLQ
jgi:alkanesulfonate monooxygenase SsuD/methylene tetrahydromethanopterin reductase-like flavin-dependent oxidoreductase (luciferase family)